MRRLYWWPFGLTGPRIEINSALRLYRLGQLPEAWKFERNMRELIEGWGQATEFTNHEKE